MKYLKNTTEFYIEEPTVLSLGKFDGIHRGHELLMEHLASKKEDGLAAVIFTFNIPPRKSVEQIEAKVLTTNEEKMHIFMKSITMMYPVIQIHMRVSMISLRSVIHLLLSVLPVDLQKQEI